MLKLVQDYFIAKSEVCPLTTGPKLVSKCPGDKSSEEPESLKSSSFQPKRMTRNFFRLQVPPTSNNVDQVWSASVISAQGLLQDLASKSSDFGVTRLYSTLSMLLSMCGAPTSTPYKTTKQ